MPFTRPRAVRVYDRRACSGGASWRKVGEAFAAAFDEARPTILDLVNAAKPDDPDFCDLEPIGNWTVTPQLSEELFGGTLDELELAIQYGVQLCAGGNLNPLLLRLRGRFVAQTPALRFRFLGLTARTGKRDDRAHRGGGEDVRGGRGQRGAA